MALLIIRRYFYVKNVKQFMCPYVCKYFMTLVKYIDNTKLK